MVEKVFHWFQYVVLKNECVLRGVAAPVAGSTVPKKMPWGLSTTAYTLSVAGSYSVSPFLSWGLNP